MDAETRRVIDEFVRLVEPMLHVKKVFVNDGPGDVDVWTVISAPRLSLPHDAAVFRAEAEAFRTYEEAPIDFHLLNLEELKHPLDDIMNWEQMLLVFNRNGVISESARRARRPGRTQRARL